MGFKISKLHIYILAPMSPRAYSAITRHPNLTDFYKFSIILWVLEDAESICQPTVMIKKLQSAILGSSYNQWALKPIPEQTRYQLLTIYCY